jgi:hypothetical protein
LQWIENLWTTLTEWKKNWQNTWKALSKWILTEKVLSWEWLFIWYIINSYNQYSKRPIKSHSEWIEKIPFSIKKYLSENHSKNWLVQKSWEKSIAEIKDYWELPTDWQLTGKAIFELQPWKDFKNVEWTKENLDLSKIQFEDLANNLIDILDKY